jgi:hypothetical protein
MRGRDLAPALSGTNVSRDIFSETDYRLYTHKRSITAPDGWKFILTRENGKKELYNLASDPLELTNLITAEPIIARGLEQKLQKHLAEIGDTGPWPIGCLPVYADQCISLTPTR